MSAVAPLVALLLSLAGAPPQPAPPPLDGTDTATTCRATLARRLAELERTTPRLRTGPALELAATGCRLIPEALRRAAAEAARLPRAARSAKLADAARGLSPPRCRPAGALEPATALAARCPLPAPLRATAELLADLDQGTYAFGLAVVEALRAAGVARDVARLWFTDLALAAGLEAHAARPRGAPRR